MTNAAYRTHDAEPAGRHRPLVAQLLAHGATGSPVRHGADDRQLQWVLAGGLGPLLHWATKDDAQAVPQAWRDPLLGADLTACARQRLWVDTTLDVLEACERAGVRATLLKGVSVGEEWYPSAHLRPMADVDVLLPAQACAAVEADLRARGYEPVSDEPSAPHMHHGAPIGHRARATIVELHHALFPADSPFHAASCFSAAALLASRSTDCSYHGRAAARLVPEAQLAYIAASWCNDLTLRPIHPSFLASLFDAVYLLRRCGDAFDWERCVAAAADDAMAAAALHVLASYLPRHGIAPAPPPLQRRLAAAAAGLAGPLQRRAMHAVVDRHLVGGRPWNCPFPAPVPGRYSPRHQWGKRVLGRA